MKDFKYHNKSNIRVLGTFNFLQKIIILEDIQGPQDGGPDYRRNMDEHVIFIKYLICLLFTII